jgi:hypothetical protein
MAAFPILNAVPKQALIKLIALAIMLFSAPHRAILMNGGGK